MVIRNCKIAIAVDASAKGDINVGGVVGIAENGKPYIYNCNVLNNNGRGGLRGDIITPSTSDIFMGGVMGDGEADIYACDVSIEIKTAGNCAGIIGRHNGGTIAACSNYSLTDKAGIAVVTSDASFVDNCYFISKKGAVDVPAKAKITNCHQYSQDNWPKANMLGWGETAPLNWDSSYTWAKYWTSLGSWKDIISIYPSVKGNSKI